MTWLSRMLEDHRGPLLHVPIDEAPTDNPHAPVVVLIHGIASSTSAFDYLVPFLRDGYRVVAVDLLGFGQSPVPPDAEYTLHEHVAAVAHTLHHLGLHHFTLVGHSLGCLIAARFAADHAEAVQKLVLVSPPVYQAPKEIGDRRARRKMAGYLSVYRYLRENENFTVARSVQIAKLLPIKHVMEVTEANWVPFTKSLQNCIETQTIISDVARVQTTVEVIYGRLDEFLVPENVAILSRMQDVNTHIVAINDHLIRKSMARVVAKAIAPSV